MTEEAIAHAPNFAEFSVASGSYYFIEILVNPEVTGWYSLLHLI